MTSVPTATLSDYPIHQLLTETANAAKVDLCAAAMPACVNALISFTDRIIATAEIVASHCSRATIWDTDVAYALRVVADADQASLGVCYTVSTNYKIAAAAGTTTFTSTDKGKETSSKQTFREMETAVTEKGKREEMKEERKRGSYEGGKCCSDSSGDSDYLDAREREREWKGNDVSTSSGSDSETYVDSEEEEEDMYRVEGESTWTMTFDGNGLPDYSPNPSSSSVEMERDQSVLAIRFQAMLPVVSEYCRAHGTVVSLDTAAFALLGWVCETQLELSFRGEPR